MSQGQVEIKEFGPCRIIGLSYTGKNENQEVARLWEQQFMPRRHEIDMPERPAAFGICRCVPGARDGTFEYVAAVEAKPGAAPPAGMVAVDIPRGDYVVIPVSGLGELGQAWGSAPETLSRLTEWEPYCGPAGCECATHPCFEYYTPEFDAGGPMFLYIPVKRKAVS